MFNPSFVGGSTFVPPWRDSKFEAWTRPLIDTQPSWLGQKIQDGFSPRLDTLPSAPKVWHALQGWARPLLDVNFPEYLPFLPNPVSKGAAFVPSVSELWHKFKVSLQPLINVRTPDPSWLWHKILEHLKFPSFLATMRSVSEVEHTLLGWIRSVAVIDGILTSNPRRTLFISLLIFIGPWLLLPPLLLLHFIFFLVLQVIGFGVSGIVRGSPAAAFQSRNYGGFTPSYSLFAFLQSTGMRYNTLTVSNWVFVLIRLVAGGAAFGAYAHLKALRAPLVVVST